MDGNKITHVICPYCCHRFAPNEADFRLTEPLKKADAKAGGSAPKKKGRKAAGADKILDEKLREYNLNTLGLDEKESERKAQQYAAVSLDEGSIATDAEDLEKYGFYSKITYTDKDGNSYQTDTRLCPSCHNTLPVGYGLRQTLLISIIGDARAGKSVYLTMLINELENNKDFPSKLSFIGDADSKEIIFSHYQKPLLQDRVLIDSTKRKRIPPFSYNFWYQHRAKDGSMTENTVDIIFYDIAGEDMRDDFAMRQNGFNIKDSSGLIFLLDPTNFKSMKDMFMLKDRSIIDAIPPENSIQNVFSAMFNYFIGMNREKSSIPLALAVSKADLFRFIELPFFANRPESRMQYEDSNETFRGFIDMGKTRSLNIEVKELLKHLNEESVIHNACGCFKHINCFAISSLGRKPITEKISDPETNETIERGCVDGEPEPFRVKDPFYWIMLKNNLLYYYEADGFYSNEEKPAPGAKGYSGPFAGLLELVWQFLGKFVKD